MSDQAPISFRPLSHTSTWPLASPSSMEISRPRFWVRFTNVPVSHTITAPPPYSPSGITPSNPA